MNLNLEGKTALVTGSAAGIGLNIALKLHEYGCQIGINSRNQKSLKNAKTFFKDSVLEIVADMTSEDSAKAAITQFVNKYGTLDILVCNVPTEVRKSWNCVVISCCCCCRLVITNCCCDATLCIPSIVS